MSALEHIPRQGGCPDLSDVDVTLNHSELFRAECRRMILDADTACKRMHDDDSKRLDQRVRDIDFLKKELGMKLNDLHQETEALTHLQNRVRRALEALKEPLRVTNLCLEERMKRVPCERLHDNVDKELLREREVTEGVMALFQRVIEQISEQIRLNRSTMCQVEQDMKEKSEASQIDDTCSIMTISNMKCLPSKIRCEPQSGLEVTPEQWENLSEINLGNVEKQKANSQSLRALVVSILEQATNDMQMQHENTTEALKLNVQEIQSAKNQMEEKMPKVQFEISSQEKIRDDLRCAIAENKQFLNLAQTRLALRKQRPGKEQCHDEAQIQLLRDVQRLSNHIQDLCDELAQSEMQDRALLHCLVNLQESIRIKASSLYIDGVVCLGLREPICIPNF